MNPGIVRAREKLLGNTVATPLIGALQLPGLQCPVDLRIKPENLQIGGGVWFRGAMLELAQHFGALKGIVIDGDARRVFGGVCAAMLQRVATVAVVARESMTPEMESLFAGQAVTVELVDADVVDAKASELAGSMGFQRLPGLESPRYAEGIATVGLELADELPFDTACVFVAPAELAEPIRAGLKAGARGCAVHGVDAEELGDLGELIEKIRVGARLSVDVAGAAALHAALHRNAGASPCVVLSS